MGKGILKEIEEILNLSQKEEEKTISLNKKGISIKKSKKAYEDIT